MAALVSKKNNTNLYRIRPLQRIILSLIVSALVFLFIRNEQFNTLLLISILWIVFAMTFVVTSFIIFINLPAGEIAKRANEEDGGRTFVFFSILISSFASMFTVLLLMISDKIQAQKTLTEIVAIIGMVTSWMLVHTIFSFHYARMYYFKKTEDNIEFYPLNFPSKEKPDYLDFAYFSFVIGMTFQVSDVEISARVIRRTVLLHSLLSFALNTFVVALTINLIAGLKH